MTKKNRLTCGKRTCYEYYFIFKVKDNPELVIMSKDSPTYKFKFLYINLFFFKDKLLVMGADVMASFANIYLPIIVYSKEKNLQYYCYTKTKSKVN